jgi:acyl dehydratase
MTHIRFTPEDLELFSRASHDRNPLHLSDEYARRTPYGGRVVFGVLDGLTAKGSIGARFWKLSLGSPQVRREVGFQVLRRQMLYNRGN